MIGVLNPGGAPPACGGMVAMRRFSRACRRLRFRAFFYSRAKKVSNAPLHPAPPTFLSARCAGDDSGRTRRPRRDRASPRRSSAWRGHLSMRSCAECEAGECRSATVRSRHLRRSPAGPGRRARVGPDVSRSCRASCRTPTTNSFLGRSAPPSARTSPRRPGIDTRNRDPRRALARYASTSSAWGTGCFRQR